MTRNVHAELETTISTSPIVLFMKGDADMPQCGFSAVVVQILKLLDKPFTTVNVLLDPEIRQGIKDYSNWPTIPQLYIQGEFIGGCDIIREMHQTGELRQIVDAKGL